MVNRRIQRPGIALMWARRCSLTARRAWRVISADEVPFMITTVH
jgi:hypothetical protein